MEMRVRLLPVVALAAAYFALGYLGLRLADVHPAASAVWPAAGLAVAALVWFGRGMWPGVALGAFGVNLWWSGDLFAASGIAIGNTLAGLAAASIVLRVGGGVHAFERPDRAALFLGAATLAAAIAATVGVATLALRGLLGASAASVGVTWWLGDLVGMLAVTPTLLLLRRHAWRDREVPLVFAGTLLLVGGLLLAPQFGIAAALAALFVLPIVWAAFRIGPHLANAVALFAIALTTGATVAGVGPFVGATSLLEQIAFMGGIAVAAIVIGSVAAERSTALARLRASQSGLEQVVARRTRRIRETVARLEKEVTKGNELVAELQKRTKQLDESQRTAHVGSWEWDIAADKITWSDELYRLYGRTREQFTADYEHFLEVVHPEDRERVDRHVQKAFADTKPFTFYHRLVRPNGEERTLHARGHVEVDDGKPIRMSGTAQDVTEFLAAQAARQQAEERKREVERLREVDEFRTRFMNTAAHELGTPLTPIRLELHLLRRHLEKSDLEGGHKALGLLERNVDRLMLLVDDLLDGARLQAGRMKFAMEELDLAQLAEEAVAAAQPVAEEKRILLRVQGNEPLPVKGDAKRLGQVLDNLVGNAIKFTPPDGDITIVLEQGESGPRIRVEDTGLGIDPGRQPHLFQPFTQVHEGTSYGGTGLGLYICKGIIRLHGGEIGCKSDGLGQGACFWFELPRVRNRPKRRRARAEVPAVAPA